MKVVLSGYYGFANTGDEAILLAITRELKRLGHTPIVLSSDPIATTREYNVQSTHRMRPLELLGAIAGADALLSGGGGLLQDKTSRRTLTYYLWIIRIAKMLGKRVAVFNQSVGPLSPEGGRAVSSALKNVTAIVRDTGSVKTLQEMGVKSILGGDPALLLEAPDVIRDEKLVVIAPRGGQSGATARLVQLAARLIESGHRVLALSFQPVVDTPEIDAFRTVPGVEIAETADPKRALEWIAGAGAVIGVRLHAVILGAAVGTRFYGIAYDPKVAGFCTDANAPYHGVDFDIPSLEREILDGRTPDWSAVNTMRERCRASFGIALG